MLQQPKRFHIGNRSNLDQTEAESMSPYTIFFIHACMHAAFRIINDNGDYDNDITVIFTAAMIGIHTYRLLLILQSTYLVCWQFLESGRLS